MKNRFVFLFIFLTALLSATHVSAASVDAASLSQTLISKMAVATAALTNKALYILGAFAAIQLLITNLALLKTGGDIEAVFGKLIGSIAWVGFCLYVLSNGPGFISDVGNEFFGIPGLDLPTPGTILTNTNKTAAAIAALTIPIGFLSNSMGIFMVYLLILVIAIGCFFSFKIFMLQLELGLIVMLAPLSFAFLGLNALKDQGIAPFKSLISLVYRILLVGVILSGFTAVDDSVKEAFSSLDSSDIIKGAGTAVNTLLGSLGAYLLLAYLLFKSDSIAATLAGGSTSMGTGDVASAAAAGAAAGAAIASGGAGAAGAATSVPQSMANFMSKLSGGGSVSNASNRGAGGQGSQAGPPPMRPSLSAGPGGASAPAFDTGKYGEPLRPSGASPASSSQGSGSQQTQDSPAQVDTSAGSGSSAGIGGGSETSNDDLLKAIQQQSGPRTPTTLDRLGTANHHMSQEKAATHVSINASASD